ncbi:alpha-amylase family glycosyl hydrolase [Dactylosporangium fulvum]|uniref:Alpha-amylase family glycosyl hydrolase n=1 Tax=Dactylosporangium fulvum TaxID=53359 RepID=A0ABY5W4P3_9ACTN|nr:alpha-amylase family glycosyl hydrolase [Dactylosporangium fulvum]UWP84429.1 alpha-amylase family glycosyl hydrolase [Dactylosporangium fulvum]
MELRRVADVDFAGLTRRAFHPSPAAWEDEVLYFLMVDRFSDGRETGCRDNAGRLVDRGGTPLISAGDHGNAVRTEEEATLWRAAGADWVGGNLAGLRSKLGYLRRLGITAVWVSPVLKQVAGRPSYHGYGIQNFLAVDPHFGTAEELRDLVAEAHATGIRVVLDVVLNHAGDVFAYEPDRQPPWMGSAYDVRGFRDAHGQPTLQFGDVPEAWPDGAVWPAELQRLGTFTGKGRIVHWDRYPEYLEGDFVGLKDITLGSGPADAYRPSPALVALTRAYQFWIAFADLDGFRVDTVKHLDPGAARYFASAIHEFAQSIGKERFYLIAEITGDRAFAYRTLDEVGMDAALGIADVQDRLESTAKGLREPREYFDLFRNSLQVGRESHTWFRDKVVTGYDDHDQVRKGDNKARFAADELGDRLTLVALALNATTLGIPCVYYGGEQHFDGRGGDDRYIREAMFGGRFGPFRSRGAHAFDEEHPTYRELARILDVRRRTPALRRGRQYLRPVSVDGVRFELPTARGLLPWSRIFADHEVLVAVNTDPDRAHTAWVTVDDGLHATGDELTCVYSTEKDREGTRVRVERRNGKSVELTVPPAGAVIYESAFLGRMLPVRSEI